MAIIDVSKADRQTVSYTVTITYKGGNHDVLDDLDKLFRCFEPQVTALNGRLGEFDEAVIMNLESTRIIHHHISIEDGTF